MGLDVYLYRYQNKDLTEDLERKYNEFSEKNWGQVSYDSLTDEQKNEYRQRDKEFASALGLDDWGDDKTNKEHIEIPSKKYPDHYFKIGYWRSSYNDGGINRILANLDLPTLTELFNTQDQYCFAPDWQLCLVKVRDVIDQLKSKPNLRCFDVSYNELRSLEECKITDEASAMTAFLEEKSKYKDDKHFEAYSNINGIFHLKEPIKVHAFLSGVKARLFSGQLMPCAYIICDGDNEWYIQALEIVEETIEYVLSQPDKDKYFLHWSS